MARTILEIKKSITDYFIQHGTMQRLYGLDPAKSYDEQFSMVSFENILFDIMAVVVWTMEGIFGVHKKEIENMISEQKVPSLRWYRNLALRFQYGFDLIHESDKFRPDYYDAVNDVWIIATADEVEASKIVKYAAVSKVSGASKISMKIAPENGNDIFTDDEMTAFSKFIEETQAAGDHIVIVNYLPDVLKLNFKIVYNPLVLLADGTSIVNPTIKPVQEAIIRFLKNLRFDGQLSVQKLEAAILAADGVDDLQNLQVSTKWIEPGVGYGFLQPVQITTIPHSGRFTIIDDITHQEDWSGIEYIV